MLWLCANLHETTRLKGTKGRLQLWYQLHQDLQFIRLGVQNHDRYR